MLVIVDNVIVDQCGAWNVSENGINSNQRFFKTNSVKFFTFNKVCL